WLVRMDHAIASISYRGTLITTGNDRIDTLRVLHRVDEGGVRERIYALDGPPREVLRDGDQVRCLISGQASLVVTNPFPTRLFPRIPMAEILGENSVYTLSLAGHGRVAARDARIIEITPTDKYRYGRTLWLDADTGMLLRSLVFDTEGEVVEKMSFVEIELGATISDSELESDLDDAAGFARYRDPASIGESAMGGPRPEWVPRNLPAGFRLASVGSGTANNPFEHLLFSDGLSSFSIYIEPGSDAVFAEHVEARGATHIYTGRVKDRIVTVVGEVPAPTVSRVGHHFLLLRHPALRHLE
ncbi:MAG: MucB/RseB C-terminal domain-containing protein, partial [Wenzhouxiangellaceae bacterium]